MPIWRQFSDYCTSIFNCEWNCMNFVVINIFWNVLRIVFCFFFITFLIANQLSVKDQWNGVANFKWIFFLVGFRDMHTRKFHFISSMFWCLFNLIFLIWAKLWVQKLKKKFKRFGSFYGDVLIWNLFLIIKFLCCRYFFVAMTDNHQQFWSEWVILSIIGINALHDACTLLIDSTNKYKIWRLGINQLIKRVLSYFLVTMFALTSIYREKWSISVLMSWLICEIKNILW